MGTYQSEQFPIPTPGRLRRELRLGRPPLWMALPLLGLILAGAVAGAVIYHIRHNPSGRPRVHLIQDMDIQPRYGPQASSAVFADGRAMRLPAAGTFAFKPVAGDPLIELGYAIGADAKTGLPTLDFAKDLPPTMRNRPNLLTRGQGGYGVYCTPCHGSSGDGHGLVNDTAVRNKETKWVPAASLLSREVRARADGDLYNTIRNGIRSMPPHGTQIPTADRWAIVAYVRELQRLSPPTTAPATPGLLLDATTTAAAPPAATQAAGAQP